jgi:hypothetical protein
MMIPMPGSIIAVALAGIASITLASGTTATSSSALSHTSTLSTVEVDVIFPVHNATYKIADSLPIVFVLQNLASAAALGPFSFGWDIMPYGTVGGIQEPDGILNDNWRTTFNTSNTSTDPYILVNQTDVVHWELGPFYPNGSVYALQWSISWERPTKTCDSDPLGAFGTLFFNVDIDGLEPDLANVTGQCPQLGGAYDIDTAAKNSSCSAVVSNSSSNNSCAVTLDKAMVGNISSSVQSLISASAAATAITANPTPSSTRHNVAVSANVPMLYVLLAALFGSIQTVISL